MFEDSHNGSCEVSCDDPGCKEVSENGVTFGRRRISLFLENVAQLNLALEATSPGDFVQLDQVLGLFTADDFSSPTQFFNFSDAIGRIVPPAVVLNPDGLAVAVDKDYTIGAIVTGFLVGDRSIPCQQVGQGTLICEKVDTLPCDCPPCIGGGDGGGGKKPKKAATLPSFDF
jgi:hypothetical protein